MIDTETVDLLATAERRIKVLEADRDCLAATVVCLVEARGGSVFIAEDRFNAVLRNHTFIVQENDDPRGITIRVSR